ncbi:MAG: dUTP diphosphatase [Patescibacteria group bacterium]|nr:dUTP diphosphatase [Patescibacteria group bacterium]
MKVKIKLIDDSLPLPNYQTGGAVAFDLYSRLEVNVESETTALVPLNIVVKIPKGYALVLANRSSTGKKGLKMVNGIGIIDQDFCGEEDEIRFFCYNFTEKNVKIERGERIAQAMFLPVEKAEFIQTAKMDKKSRGGFGTTG